ncbi:uncharacterized protein THITE_2118202 [Thermothielavioides terrestris NRRL 8126]|uniref:Uncharacterized protein n=1 Tax=Thermothielavioides terrestris (strain ATCC 38088 / NRRL 8126) TaxID=578455 RepID=G2R929_THETT|nr:uncharacterized protein THITE_2118202 [Thermothielavioides terrestris NRRL 8126]AEO68624.1 hypothetical protein THITE_2118202 [Thermothielavioides terrestris NRRL 8126]
MMSLPGLFSARPALCSWTQISGAPNAHNGDRRLPRLPSVGVRSRPLSEPNGVEGTAGFPRVCRLGLASLTHVQDTAYSVRSKERDRRQGRSGRNAWCLWATARTALSVPEVPTFARSNLAQELPDTLSLGFAELGSNRSLPVSGRRDLCELYVLPADTGDIPLMCCSFSR